jgi:hypothetical protein
MEIEFDFSKGVRSSTCGIESVIIETDKESIYVNNSNNIVQGDFLFLGEKDKERDYERYYRTNNVKWGQLKLFLEECIFLLHYSHNCKEVLYVGSSPGEHIFCLASIFSHLTFELYDPREFDSRLRDLPNVTLHTSIFEEDHISHWSKRKDFLFISDIRTLEYAQGDKTEEESEDIAWKDMKLQEEWVLRMKPTASSLKFRLPYYNDYTKTEQIREYIKGYILLQPYTSSKSSETRLINTGDFTKINYDILMYERKMFFHNTCTRNSEWIDIFPLFDLDDFGIDNTYDGCYFKYVVKSLLEATDTIMSRESVRGLCEKIINSITPKKVKRIGAHYTF